jgi:hypothetical protein
MFRIIAGYKITPNDSSQICDMVVVYRNVGCSGVPCCVIVGWFNGNQLMADLVAHYKGLFPSSLLEGFPLKTV